MQLSGVGRRVLMESAVQDWLSEQSVPERARKFTYEMTGNCQERHVDYILVTRICNECYE
jgi:hypothetical protein